VKRGTVAGSEAVAGPVGSSVKWRWWKSEEKWDVYVRVKSEVRVRFFEAKFILPPDPKKK
jgi:hypothetical protein